MTTNLPRVVELIRVSTDLQKEKGTHEVQRADLEQLRKTRPGVFVDRIEELGVSGATPIAERVELQRLFRLAKAKAFDELRVWNVDRLTRSDDPRERFAIYGAASDAGAKIVDCAGRVIDPCDDTGMGELDFYLQTLFSARERKKIGARTLAGRKLKASQGKLTQGSPPYGRRLNRQTMNWEIVEHEAEIYRRIIDAVLAGHSTRAIVKQLNADRVPPARGTKWARSSVMRLLRVKSMYGEYTVCGHTTQIPPIATRAEFDRVRAVLKSATTCPTGVLRRPAMLRRRLICTGCGQVAHVESDGAGSIPRYGCARPHEREARCPNRRTIQVPAADAAVREALLNMVRQPERLMRAVKAEQSSAPTKSRNAQLASIEKELAKLTARQTRTLALLNDGLLTDDVARGELAAIRVARIDAEARQKHLATLAETAPKKPDLLKAAAELAAAVETATLEELQELVDILVPKENPYGLWLGREGIEVVGRLPLKTAAGDMDTSSSCAARPAPGRR